MKYLAHVQIELRANYLNDISIGNNNRLKNTVLNSTIITFNLLKASRLSIFTELFKKKLSQISKICIADYDVFFAKSFIKMNKLIRILKLFRHMQAFSCLAQLTSNITCSTRHENKLRGNHKIAKKTVNDLQEKNGIQWCHTTLILRYRPQLIFIPF